MINFLHKINFLRMSMKGKVEFILDGQRIEVDEGKSILEAALENGVYIPHLCFRPGLDAFGACRLCLVETADGRLVTACETLVEDGMRVISDSQRLNGIRRVIASLLISEHVGDCLRCPSSGECKLQEVSSYLGISDEDLMGLRELKIDDSIDDSNPFFIKDNGKCVLCGLCIQSCDIIGVNAIDFTFRGAKTKIGTFMDKPLMDSICVSCGECVETCPVGALISRLEKPSREVKSVCPYCGVGCGIYLGIKGNRIVSARGDPKNPVNYGKLCVKGRFALDFVNSEERLEKPLIKQNGSFKEVGWDEAISFIADKLSKYDGDEFAAIASAKCTNEENYLLQKFTRVVMNSNNIDHCARLCHAPSLVALSKTLGSGAMTNSINELKNADCIFAIGTNTTETHPIIAYKVIEAVKNGSKLIVANPTRIELVRHADVYLRNKPGTDVPLILGMCKIILEEDLIDHDFIKEKTEGSESFIEYLRSLRLDEIESITGVPREDIRRAAILYASSPNSSIIYAMGITQHINGTDNVFALSNLALLTSNLGRAHTGVNPLRGQNNVQGSSDMGALPNLYPGYQPLEDAKEKFETKWKCKLPKENGLTLPEIFENILKGKVKALYIMGENPILSEPDIENVEKALKSLEFLIVQDIFPTETSKFADVILPACSFAEKDGTFTNTERRVQMIRSAVKPPGYAKPDWWIICKIAEKMGASGFEFENPQEIFEEIRELVPSYSGISYERLESGGIQWPCRSTEDPGTVYLYKDSFARENGRAKFIIPSFKLVEIPDEEYPFMLITGRSLYQYHTRTMTSKIKGLEEFEDWKFLQMNPRDGERLGICEGDFVLVRSRRGSARVRVRFNEALMEGVTFMSFHFALANRLTSSKRDPLSGMPGLKVSCVALTPQQDV